MDSTPPKDSGCPTDPDQHQHDHKQPPTSSELFASAKTVAEAAQFTLRNETEKVDKTRVAGAAEDLLGAASHYGKLEEKGMGQYVEKAENYLHQYSSSTTTTGGGDTTATTPSKPGGESGEQGQSGGGYGDYLSMAGRFLKN